MVGIRKRKDFFDDFGSELFDNLEEMIEALLEEMGESAPFVYGFSIIRRPGEDPELREFGNVPEYSQNEEDLFSSEIKDPLIDIFEDGRIGTRTCRVPGDWKGKSPAACDCSKS